MFYERLLAWIRQATLFSGDRAKIVRNAENIATEKWRLPTRWHKVKKELYTLDENASTYKQTKTELLNM